MHLSSTHEVLVRFTPNEHALFEGIAQIRGISPSDLVRELMGLDREDERRSARPRLQLVS
jgi:hypothetical protein